ncbi:unnamed protein product (macronuclear) [Paramecium tetraurelia]|uniref:HMG box domain-containing protein n=1 Tax=Paramecium tetraurelia TaxID=5888 RepID=A0BLW4_PARTE|nr:uncharacterized protein GSPATT00030165001 [Paramecium tetraurelia]CAK59531.1 unnamed protein product [Paramecium tetraurelia]|eukprot:XP_001426929.1 hypothetical protein (macronuclear) [Paramecium tetraurelia strain d4-2]
MNEKSKTYQNAFQIFKERYSKKLKKDKTLSQSDIDDLVLQKWKFLPDDQREPYKKRFEKTKVKLTQHEEEANNSDEEKQPSKKVKQ